MVSPRMKRAAAHQLITELGLSERKACQIVELPRSTFRRPLAVQTPADPDAGLRTWLCEYAKDHPRWGYRRAHHDARTYGWSVNHKKTQRLWREEGLRVPIRRRRKRRGSSTGEATVSAQYRNHVFAIDFQADDLEEGTGFKIASIIDEHTRVILDDTVDVSITGEDLVGIFERLSITHGFPCVPSHGQRTRTHLPGPGDVGRRDRGPGVHPAR